jgi:cyclomaltodextrinase
MEKAKPGKYRNFKGGLYEVIGTAWHSDTLGQMVIYRALYDSKEFGKNALWARPLENFLEKVTVNGKEIPRFKYLKK